MIALPLTPTERAAFERTLATSHRMRATLRLWNRNEQPLGIVGGTEAGLVSGSVTIDSTAEIRRSLSVRVLDPHRRLRVEPDSPSAGAVHADRFISAERGVYVAELGEWIDVPVFMGPVTLVQREGAEATIEAQGKEALMLAPHLAVRGYTLRRGTRVDDAIKAVARAAGERRFALPDLPAKLRRGRAVGPQSEPWKVIRGGEESAKGKVLPGLIDRGGSDFEPYYNGRGELTARRRGGSSRFTFTTGDGGTVTGEPQFRYDVQAFRNAVLVIGGRRKKRPRARAFVALGASHPLSPSALARNGEPRYLVEVVEADGLKTDRACEQRGRVTLDRVAREGVSAAFECLPVPHLEEDDEVTLRTDELSVSFPIEQMTIPLTATESMSVGALKRVPR